jgi:hypothetical protein
MNLLRKLTFFTVLLTVSLFAQTATWVQGTTTPPISLAPPAPYTITFTPSTSASVFTQPSYIEGLNLAGFQQAANINNALAWQSFSTAWSNWVAAGANLTAIPPHPVYQTVDPTAFANYWSALTRNGTGYNAAITPAPYNLPISPGFAALATAPTNLVVVTPAPAPTPTDPVGIALGNGYYADVAGDMLPAGSVFTDSRGTFTKQVYTTPFGKVSFWQ